MKDQKSEEMSLSERWEQGWAAAITKEQSGWHSGSGRSKVEVKVWVTPGLLGDWGGF